MKRSEIRTFIEAGVTAVNSSLDFGYGRITEWNSNRSNLYPGVWWESDQPVAVELTENQLPVNSWPVRLHIGKKDKADSMPSDYDLLVDDCDLVAQQLIRQYSQILEGALYDLVAIEDISREPFIKKNADLITGVLLTFTLKSPDTTSLC